MPKAPEDKPEEKKEDSLLIEVPFDESAVACTFGGHLQFHASPELRNRLLQVTAALDRRKARLLGGKRVTEPTQAMQWIAEQLLIVKPST